MKRALRLLFLALAAAPAAAAVDIPDAVVVLEVRSPLWAGMVPEAAPPRFVLTEEGDVFVGGTRDVLTARLSADDRKALEKRIADVRKMPGLSGTVSFGAGDQRFRLLLRRGRAIDMQISGDPASAPAPLQPLARLVQDLAAYGHDALRPYNPRAYSMSARLGQLPGGCRRWRGAEPVSRAVFAPRTASAQEIKEREWPTGAVAASICEGDKRYIVTFRPLLPGEPQ